MDVFLTVACYAAGKASSQHEKWRHHNNMEPIKETYHSYLLRLWQTEQNGNLLWRCSLEEARTGQRQNFACLAALLNYLLAETGQQPIASQEEEK